MSDRSYVRGCAMRASMNDSRPTGADPLSAGTGVTLSAAPTTPVITNPITGDYRIDALLGDASMRWNSAAAMGTPITVTCSFMTGKPTYGGTDEGTDAGFGTFKAAQIAATLRIFAKLQTELGIHFREVGDANTSYGQIRLGNNTQTSSGGYAFLPNSTEDDKSGDIWINQGIAYNVTNVTPGTAGYRPLVHEIGHAIGIKHPGYYNAGDPTSTVPGNFLGSLEDNANFSMMSYRDAKGEPYREWFGVHDLLAPKQLYGSGSQQAGNSIYTRPTHQVSCWALSTPPVDSTPLTHRDAPAASTCTRRNLAPLASTFPPPP